jgi:hypothetical protein
MRSQSGIQTFARDVLDYHFSLRPDIALPDQVKWLYPYDQEEVREAMSRFFTKYFSDQEKRTVLIGINPGRYGAGITGVPFTDPIRMETECSLLNTFPKKQELSSVFVYEVINAMGGVADFYRHFYITSICPLGFVRNGKNYNYYDSPVLTEAILPMIIDNLEKHISFGLNQEVAFSLGQGKNFTFLEKLNARYRFFRKIIPLPHPRWVMQYRLKSREQYVQEYITKLSRVR